jgi:hypothetical protein
MSVSILIAVAALTLQAEPPPASDAPEITVIAERMRRLKLETKTDRKTGVTQCVLKRSSGDKAFDTMMCNAVLGCAKTVSKSAEMEACLAPQMAAYSRELAARGTP